MSPSLGEIDGVRLPIERNGWVLKEEDFTLYAMLSDPVYMPEVVWKDPTNHDYAGAYRVHPEQYQINRCEEQTAIFACGRATGKTQGQKSHAQVHCFTSPAEDMLMTAPELIHLLPLTDAVEDSIRDSRLLRECLDVSYGKTGFTHRPFGVNLNDGTKLVGRIPKLKGTGVLGQHAPFVMVEESQSYPTPGWSNLEETVNYDAVDKYGNPRWRYWAFGVHDGNRQSGFSERAKNDEWKVIQVTRLQRADWSKEAKERAKASYGGTSSPDYRRNILGEPGDAASAYFVTARLMSCFRAGTPVLTTSGFRPIEEISVGDEIKNAQGAGFVTDRIVTQSRRVARVVTNYGEEFICSPEHPFLTPGGWKHADKLAVGEELVDRSKALRSLWNPAKNEADKVLFETLLRDMAWDGRLGSWEHRAHLSPMRKGLRPIGGGQVLRPEMYGNLRGRPQTDAQAALRRMRRVVPAEEAGVPLLQLCVSGESERRAQWSSPRTPSGYAHPECEKRRSAGTTVQALEGAPETVFILVPTVLDESARDGEGSRAFQCRHCEPAVEDRGGSGWEFAHGRDRGQAAARKRQAPGQVAAPPRVDRVQILEPGSEGWTRHCGEADSLALYDLTVSGHPSFVVGESELVVHNCVDQRVERGEVKGSDYNTKEYQKQTFRAEELEADGLKIADALDLPHGYESVYGGVDVGLNRSPTVISLFTETMVSGRLRLKLFRRFTLERLRSKQIRQALYAIDLHFGGALMGMGVDSTGLGLPLMQELEDDEVCPPHLSQVIRGYFFSEKVPVAVAPENVYRDETTGIVKDQYGRMLEEQTLPDGSKRFIVRAPFITASTNYLAKWVDSGYLLLPFDQEVIADMLGETKERVERLQGNAERAGGAMRKPDIFHILDSFRGMAMAYHATDIEEALAIPQQRPVFDEAF